MDARNIYCRANILLALERHEEARKTHEDALSARIKAFDETHPDTAVSYWKLGVLWEDDDWTKAMYT